MISAIDELKKQRAAAIQAENERIAKERKHQEEIERLDSAIMQAETAARRQYAENEAHTGRQIAEELKDANQRIVDAITAHDIDEAIAAYRAAIAIWERLHTANRAAFNAFVALGDYPQKTVSDSLTWTAHPQAAAIETAARQAPGEKRIRQAIIFAITNAADIIHPSDEYNAHSQTVKERIATYTNGMRIPID